jgi:hypothetical protein
MIFPSSVNPLTPLQGYRQLLTSDIAEELHEMLIKSHHYC